MTRGICHAKLADLPCKRATFALPLARMARASHELAATSKSLTIKELEMARHRSRHRWSGQKWDFLRSYWIQIREKALGVAHGITVGCPHPGDYALLTACHSVYIPTRHRLTPHTRLMLLAARSFARSSFPHEVAAWSFSRLLVARFRRV